MNKQVLQTVYFIAGAAGLSLSIYLIVRNIKQKRF